MPQQDADASEAEEAEVVLEVALPARDQEAVVLQPGQRMLHLPALHIAEERSAREVRQGCSPTIPLRDTVSCF